MAKFLLAYKGGGMGASPEEQQKAMEAWMGWFGSLGGQLVDQGSPFAPGSSAIASDGSVTAGGASSLTGYSIISADTLAEATRRPRAARFWQAAARSSSTRPWRWAEARPDGGP